MNFHQNILMRISDDRYSRERARMELALRFLHHEARTQTIRAWTGLSDDRIRKLDIDANPSTTTQYQVMSVPTLTIFNGGQPVQSIVGAHPKSALLRMIEAAI